VWRIAAQWIASDSTGSVELHAMQRRARDRRRVSEDSTSWGNVTRSHQSGSSNRYICSFVEKLFAFLFAVRILLAYNEDEERG
jgi:hypothetical protein